MSDQSQDITVEFTLNGEPITHTARARRSALDVLREDFDIKSAKSGCSPQGVCGCCVMMVGGKPRVTCTLPFKSLKGKAIESLEGFSDEERAILAESFVRAGGTQCGYCTPGIAVATKALLDKNPSPDRKAKDKALQMHICRCTGWNKIHDAIDLAAAMRRGEEPVALSPEEGGVGDNLPRNEGHDLVLGERAYIDDMVRPGMLHGAVVWTPRPRCKILKIDASEALALDGVHSVATAADYPGDRRVGLIFRDWPVMIAEGEETRCVADILAAVAADTRELAMKARDLVKVEFEELPGVFTLEEAVQNPDNLLATSRVNKGDAETALAEADVVIRENFQVQVQDQAFLEPEASLVVPRPDGSLWVYSCGQGVFDDRKQLCELFGMPEDKIVVELVTTGGAFGGKEDLNVQPHAAILALKTGRPVKLSLSMEESTRFHPKRHAMKIAFELGAKKDGTFTAIRTTILGDTGGYASVGDKVLERAAGHACGAYRVPNVAVEAHTIYTNNPVCGAFRGFGVNQIAFALEGCIDRLTKHLDLDPWEIRHKNALRPGDRFGTGQVIDASAGAIPTLEAIKPRYDEARAAGKHVGLAMGVKNTGMGNGLKEVGRVVLEVRSAEDICIKTGFTEMGQGHNTVMRQFAAEATGLSASLFTVECDTTLAVEVGMTTASRGTYLGGNGVLAAAPAFLEALKDAGGELGGLIGRRFHGEWWAPDTWNPEDGTDVDNPVTHYGFGWATQLAIIGEDGRLEELVAAHDVGRAINPVLCEGQIEGGVHMGIGYALSEDLVLKEPGVPTDRYLKLGVIKSKYTPTITPILVETADLHGPWGAKGVGEIGLVPTAPAIAGALREHDGQWRNVLPMKETEAARGVGVRLPRKR